MTRIPPLLLVLAAGAFADETTLGTYIRWYLAETHPGRREDLLDRIERSAAGDAAAVARALRAGEHCVRGARPALGAQGQPPLFRDDRVQVLPVAGAAGGFALLALPADYDASRSWPLVVDLAAAEAPLPAPPGAILLRVDSARHPQAARSALHAESLLLSLVAHAGEIASVDPDRVLLRGQGEGVALAAYIAQHSPDRFAGLLLDRGGGKGPLPAPAPEGGGAAPEGLFSNERIRNLLAIDARESGAEAGAEFARRVAEWAAGARRDLHPHAIALAIDRPVPMRCFWLRAVPQARSEVDVEVGARAARGLRRLARITATVEADNLVRVQAENVAAFDLFVDPEVLDLRKPLRVGVNGGIPEARVIAPSVADLLEDFAERRDAGLLYLQRLTFKVPGR